jgi:rhamnogalacturonan endolyase
VRLYTLAHNPAYRNGLTVKGYIQLSLPDYYLRDGMSAPPRAQHRYR